MPIQFAETGFYWPCRLSEKNTSIIKAGSHAARPMNTIIIPTNSCQTTRLNIVSKTPESKTMVGESDFMDHLVCRPERSGGAFRANENQLLPEDSTP